MTTPYTQLSELAANQASKYLTHNEAMQQLDARGGRRVISRTNGGPPGSPAEGDVYIVDVASGGWTGYAVGSIAHYYSSAWHNVTPKEGYSFWVNSEDRRVTYDGSAWVSEGFGAVDVGATDNAIVRTDGTGGDAVQGSSATIDDNGVIVLPNTGGIKIEDTASPANAVSAIAAAGDDLVLGDAGYLLELVGSGSNPTYNAAEVLLKSDVDDTPVDGATDVPASSNWAYDHVAATNPHAAATSIGGVAISNIAKLDAAQTFTGSTNRISSNKTFAVGDAGANGAIAFYHQSSLNLSKIIPVVGGVFDETKALVFDADTPYWSIGTATKYEIYHTGNDGSGSGLDADLLDGQHGSAYATLAEAQTFTGVNTFAAATVINNNIYLSAKETGGTSRTVFGMSGSNIFEAGNPNNATNLRGSSLTWNTTNTVYHSGNDGSGSGLDADLLDGAHGSEYAKLNTHETFTAAKSMSKVYRAQGTPTAKTATGTLTAAELDAGLMTSSSGAVAITLTLPTATAMDTYFTNVATNYSVDMAVLNISTNSAGTCTIAAGTGWTLVGQMLFQANSAASSRSSGTLRMRKTGAGAWTCYRI